MTFFMVAAVARTVATMGQVLIYEGERGILAFRLDVFNMSLIFIEQTLAINAESFLFEVKLSPNRWPDACKRRIIP